LIWCRLALHIREIILLDHSRHGFKPLAQGEWDNCHVWHAASGV
jgi:hypothetical protein